MRGGWRRLCGIIYMIRTRAWTRMSNPKTAMMIAQRYRFALSSLWTSHNQLMNSNMTLIKIKTRPKGAPIRKKIWGYAVPDKITAKMMAKPIPAEMSANWYRMFFFMGDHFLKIDSMAFPLASASTSFSRYRSSRVSGSSIFSTRMPQTAPVKRARLGLGGWGRFGRSPHS